jgi:hypothetical protein
MVLLVTSLPKVLTLEDGVRVTMAHRALIEAFEHYLDTVEPTSKGSGSDPPARNGTGSRPSRSRDDHVRSGAPKSLN